MPPLKRAAARVIASRLPFDQIRGLRELFASIDADRSGGVSLDELQRVRIGARGRREKAAPPSRHTGAAAPA
jgi:Ca2+-binding EF-hand superfamily protein